MTPGILHRLEALERRADALARWRGALTVENADEADDEVLLAIIGEAEGWPPGYAPSDAELEAIVARSRRAGATRDAYERPPAHRGAHQGAGRG
jgi:hypothetical protein